MSDVTTDPRTGAATRLRVRKRTGTAGDTLIAWGLALVAAEVAKRDVVLSDAPNAFEVIVRASPIQLAQAYADYLPSARVKMPWLASTEKKRHPPIGVDYAVDRDVLRDDYDRLRARGQRLEAGSDAPAVAAHPLAPRYPLFQVLTNPGTQWIGFNSFAERAQVFLTPPGAEKLLETYASEVVDDGFDAALDDRMRQLGLNASGDRRRNPPGFLFPGASKGPTMRLDRGGTVIGQTAALDWMQADRGDLSIAELYLAYVGFFAVGVILPYKAGRVMAVPVPDRVLAPRVVAFLDRLRPRTFPTSPAAIAADAALGYGLAALDYVRGLVAEETQPNRSTLVFNGVQLAVFWMPNGYTYALDHVTFAPLPRWLAPLRLRGGYDEAAEVLTTHRRRIDTVGQADGDEAREATRLYRESLDGSAFAWLRMVPTWYRAVLAERFVTSWSTAEVEEVAVALQPELRQVIDDPAFEAVTGAIRRSTIQAHYARKNRQAGDQGVVTSNRPGNPLSPQYDLIGVLQEAAARHPDEFLRELCEFVAAYNDEAMRREQRLVRKEDLAQIVTWITDDRRGIVPALILAFGVSPRRRAADAPVEEVLAGEARGEAEDVSGA